MPTAVRRPASIHVLHAPIRTVLALGLLACMPEEPPLSTKPPEKQGSQRPARSAPAAKKRSASKGAEVKYQPPWDYIEGTGVEATANRIASWAVLEGSLVSTIDVTSKLCASQSNTPSGFLSACIAPSVDNSRVALWIWSPLGLQEIPTLPHHMPTTTTPYVDPIGNVWVPFTADPDATPEQERAPDRSEPRRERSPQRSSEPRGRKIEAEEPKPGDWMKLSFTEVPTPSPGRLPDGRKGIWRFALYRPDGSLLREAPGTLFPIAERWAFYPDGSEGPLPKTFYLMDLTDGSTIPIPAESFNLSHAAFASLGPALIGIDEACRTLLIDAQSQRVIERGNLNEVLEAGGAHPLLRCPPSIQEVAGIEVGGLVRFHNSEEGRPVLEAADPRLRPQIHVFGSRLRLDWDLPPEGHKLPRKDQGAVIELALSPPYLRMRPQSAQSNASASWTAPYRLEVWSNPGVARLQGDVTFQWFPLMTQEPTTETTPQVNLAVSAAGTTGPTSGCAQLIDPEKRNSIWAYYAGNGRTAPAMHRYPKPAKAQKNAAKATESNEPQTYPSSIRTPLELVHPGPMSWYVIGDYCRVFHANGVLDYYPETGQRRESPTGRPRPLSPHHWLRDRHFIVDHQEVGILPWEGRTQLVRSSDPATPPEFLLHSSPDEQGGLLLLRQWLDARGHFVGRPERATLPPDPEAARNVELASYYWPLADEPAAWAMLTSDASQIRGILRWPRGQAPVITSPKTDDPANEPAIGPDLTHFVQELRLAKGNPDPRSIAEQLRAACIDQKGWIFLHANSVSDSPGQPWVPDSLHPKPASLPVSLHQRERPDPMTNAWIGQGLDRSHCLRNPRDYYNCGGIWHILHAQSLCNAPTESNFVDGLLALEGPDHLHFTDRSDSLVLYAPSGHIHLIRPMHAILMEAPGP
jgi:hypothetical protein